jgi:hypothetical protein
MLYSLFAEMELRPDLLVTETGCHPFENLAFSLG